MATVSKQLAESEIERLKKQKRPKVYCVVRYQNRLSGDSERGTYSDYSICFRREQYEALLFSDFVGGVDVLWASKRFNADQKERKEAELFDLP